jgi:hypothetical protein
MKMKAASPNVQHAQPMVNSPGRRLALSGLPRYARIGGEQDMKSRFLTESEKRDVAAAAMEFLKSENPGCTVHVMVEDETDDRGVPRYRATITPAKRDEA